MYLSIRHGYVFQGIAYCDLGIQVKNKLIGWVDSDFGSDPDIRKSMNGYLMSLNDDTISWRSSRQGGVTLSSSEAEFVAGGTNPTDGHMSLCSTPCLPSFLIIFA